MDVILPYNFSVHVSLTIPVNLDMLCINIGINMQRKKNAYNFNILSVV